MFPNPSFIWKLITLTKSLTTRNTFELACSKNSFLDINRHSAPLLTRLIAGVESFCSNVSRPYKQSTKSTQFEQCCRFQVLDSIQFLLVMERPTKLQVVPIPGIAKLMEPIPTESGTVSIKNLTIKQNFTCGNDETINLVTMLHLPVFISEKIRRNSCKN